MSIEVQLRIQIPYSQHIDVIGATATGDDFDETLQLAVEKVRADHQIRLDIEAQGAIVHRGGYASWPDGSRYEGPPA